MKGKKKRNIKWIKNLYYDYATGDGSCERHEIPEVTATLKKTYDYLHIHLGKDKFLEAERFMIMRCAFRFTALYYFMSIVGESICRNERRKTWQKHLQAKNLG